MKTGGTNPFGNPIPHDLYISVNINLIGDFFNFMIQLHSDIVFNEKTYFVMKPIGTRLQLPAENCKYKLVFIECHI